jgi:hypothetical protein
MSGSVAGSHNMGCLHQCWEGMGFFLRTAGPGYDQNVFVKNPVFYVFLFYFSYARPGYQLFF